MSYENLNTFKKFLLRTPKRKFLSGVNTRLFCKIPIKFSERKNA